MNIKHAAGFFFLGLLMHVTPMVAPALALHSDNTAYDSVRALWLAVMSWVVGGIGSGYLLRDAARRTPALAASLLPARLFRPAEAQGAQVPVGARVGVSS